MCSKKSRFMKKQEASGILNNLGLKTLLNKISLLGDILFQNYKYERINMPEMHLKQTVFTYSACGPFNKNKERIQKFKETEIQSIFTEMNQIKLVFGMIQLRKF